MSTLPIGLQVKSEIEIANTGLSDLPVSLRDVRLLWRFTPITYPIAFQPESITVRQICRRAELSVTAAVLLAHVSDESDS